MKLVLLCVFVFYSSGQGLFTVNIHQCRRYSFSNRPSQDCAALGLTELPKLFTEVVSLNVANNSISSVDTLPANYSTLLTLRMDHCKLEKITVNALSQLRNLRTLDLSHNYLQHIVFSPYNRKLTTLNLAHNHLRHLPDLSALVSLRLLDLSFNRLISISPRFFPFNVESLRLTGNQLTHLNQWPLLTKLQELDVSFNPLVCECPLWRFVSWAEGLALFDSSTLPCMKPRSLRRSSSGEFLCGPEVWSSSSGERVVLSLGEPHQMCCVVAASPSSDVRWTLDGRNISKGLSVRHLTESGRARHCIDINRIGTDDMGTYRCVANLEGMEEWREFIVERDKVPLVLNSAEHLLFYFQFSLCVFVVVFCAVSCCCIRRRRAYKTKPQKEYIYTPPSFPPTPLPPPDTEASTVSATSSEWQRIQIEIWKDRVMRQRAPLANFDQDTNIMPLIHTSV